MYATHPTFHGWTIIHVTDGQAVTIAHVGDDRTLAEQLRDWLTHQDRIQTLLDRHGLEDVPLTALGEP